MKTATFVLMAFLSAFSFGQSDAEVEKILVAASRERMSQINDAWFHDGEYLPIIQSQYVLSQLNIHDEETWSNLAWMCQNTEQYDAQLAIVHKFSRLNSTYADGPYYEAQFYYLKKAFAKIPALLEPAIKLSPRPDDNAYRFLAHSYEKLGYLEDALRIWDMYIKLNPKDRVAVANRKKIQSKIK